MLRDRAQFISAVVKRAVIGRGTRKSNSRLLRRWEDGPVPLRCTQVQGAGTSPIPRQMWLWVLVLLVPGSLAADPLPAPINPKDFDTAPMQELLLGRDLFYDPILSGNRTVACATCHHPSFATGDGLALGIGDGGIGLGPKRALDAKNLPEQRIPRNAPPLFNLGHASVDTLFADGRIQTDATRASGMRTPLDDDMVTGFDGILSAQTMFPVLSGDEMAGHYQENDIAKAVRLGIITGDGGAWNLIADRVAEIPTYRAQFKAVYPKIAEGKTIEFTDISNAIAAFMAFEWRADDSAFDRHLRQESRLGAAAAAGRDLFYGTAGCSTCHAGALLSDQKFHAMGDPQLGPGKAGRFETHQRDVGRMRVTGRAEDAYAFRTPMLRNVTETGPWGHAGAHSDLRAYLVYHADPKRGLAAYAQPVELPAPEHFQNDWNIMESPAEMDLMSQAITFQAVPLDDAQIDALLAFLEALRDPQSLEGRLGIPDKVPSGLPVERP